MPTLPAARTAPQLRQPANLKTSELLREVAGLLEDKELAFELRVRARWIEGARNDQGVSEERRRGIAAIEDVEAAAPKGRTA